jgi:hypothetical protein
MFSMNVELSMGIEMVTPLGSWSRSFSTRAFTRWATSTVFEPDCLRTSMVMDEVPLRVE